MVRDLAVGQGDHGHTVGAQAVRDQTPAASRSDLRGYFLIQKEKHNQTEVKMRTRYFSLLSFWRSPPAFS